MLDFGIADNQRAVEVFDLPATPQAWRSEVRSSQRVTPMFGRVAREADLPADWMEDSCLVNRLGTPVLLPKPGLSAMPPLEASVPKRPRGGAASKRVGIVRPWPEELDGVLEALETGSSCGPRVLFVAGGPGTTSSAVWLQLAREVRLRGFIPVIDRCLASGTTRGSAPIPGWVLRAISGRHLVVFHDARREAGSLSIEARRRAIFRLIPTLAEAGRPHLLLVARHSPQSPGICLARQPESIARRFTSRASNGSSACSIAAESPASYDVTRARRLHGLIDPPGVRAALALAQRGFCLVTRGRHAPGERLMRRALGALERRQASAHAGHAALRLGGLTLRRGFPAEALELFRRARGAFDRAGVAAGVGAAAIAEGLAHTDADRLAVSDSTLRATIAASLAIDDQALASRGRLALARCLYWQGKLDDARREVDLSFNGADKAAPRALDAAAVSFVADAPNHACQSRETVPGPTGSWDEHVAAASDVSLEVAGHALNCRIAVAEGALPRAALSARQAVAAAERTGHAHDLWTAERAMAEFQAATGDVAALRQHVRRGMSAAHALHLPPLSLRLRLTLVEGLRRAARPAESQRAARALCRMDVARVPALLRGRVKRAREGSVMGANVVALSSADTKGSLHGIGRLHVRPADGSISQGSDSELLSDLVEFVRMCQEADDLRALLEQVCARVLDRLDAVSVALVAASSDGPATLASAGRRLGPTDIVDRAIALGTSIGPQVGRMGHEAAAPVRYLGEVTAALACRWAVDRIPDAARSAAMVTAAASSLAFAVHSCLEQAAARQAEAASQPSGLVGISKGMVELRHKLSRAAVAPFPVLIQGESGTGKELVARAIHEASRRRAGRFCAVNCAAFGDDLLEAELFGHARGAFTGAVSERPGLFEAADGGTLFLDEVGELSPRAQAKLLRAIQEGEIRRIGENACRSVDVRLVAATNRPLREAVREGRFRQDLLYRLDVIGICVPALRHRPEDIPVLAARFWEEARSRTGSRAEMAPGVLAALSRYEWPGNARELQNVMATLAVAAPARGIVGIDALPDAFRARSAVLAIEAGTLDQARRRFDEGFVKAALSRAAGRRSRAAAELGLTRQGLAKLLARLGIDGSD